MLTLTTLPLASTCPCVLVPAVLFFSVPALFVCSTLPSLPASLFNMSASVYTTLAVAEELLFRGLLLTAVQQRLGATDAVAVCGAMFALSHLDLQQFFLYCVLGGASGLAAVRSGSVGPAMVLHAAFNATAVGAGLLLHYW